MDPIHLLGIKDLKTETLQSILNIASSISHSSFKAPENLKQTSILNMFFENSSRTSLSFRLAQSKLGLITHEFSPSASSLSKGESFRDTLQTMEAIGFDMCVIRHQENDIFDEIKDGQMSIINAGNGTNEHPTQALLDLLTIYQEFGKFEGLNLAIIGDIKHSRVANSLMYAWQKLGGNLKLSGPPELRAPGLPAIGATVGEIDEVIEDADVIVLLRAQLERHVGVEFNASTYNDLYGMNGSRLAKLKEGTIIMHPGPFNRGIEITSEVVSSPRSRIFKQVQNGTIMRMAIMSWLAANRQKRGLQ